MENRKKADSAGRAASGGGRVRLRDRLLAGLLCLALPLLFSCAGSSGADSGKTDDSSARSDESSSEGGEGKDSLHSGRFPFSYASPEQVLAGLPTANFEGGAIQIAAAEGCPLLSLRGTLLPSSLAQVYDAIEARYQTYLYPTGYSETELLKRCREAVEKGEYFADVVAIPLSQFAAYRAENLLAPLETLPYLAADGKISGEGLLSGEMEKLRAEGGSYAALGTGCFSQLGGVCLLLNHRLFAANGQDPAELYAAVENGDWTWEMLFEHFPFSAQSSGAPGASESASAPLWGSTVSEKTLTAAICRSLEGTADAQSSGGGADKNAPASAQSSGDGADENALAAARKITEEVAVWGEDASAAFAEGKLPVLVTTVAALYEYPSSEDSWDCLPLPKGAAGEGSYAVYLDPDSTYVYAVLRNTPRAEAAGLYLLAINACTAKSCFPQIPQDLLAGYIREGGAMKMLPYLFSNPLLDQTAVLPEKTAEKPPLKAEAPKSVVDTD